MVSTVPRGGQPSITSEVFTRPTNVDPMVGAPVDLRSAGSDIQPAWPGCELGNHGSDRTAALGTYETGLANPRTAESDFTEEPA
jgi:hypothetical protein